MPELERLGALVEEVRAAGLPVELPIEGTPRPLDAGSRAGGLPDRPGGPDQRAQARAWRPRRGRPRATSRRAVDIEVSDEGGTGQRDIGRERPVADAASSACASASPCTAATLEAGPTRPGSGWHARLPIDHPSPRRTDDVTAPIRVLLVDDQELVRAGFRMILEDVAGHRGRRRGRRRQAAVEAAGACGRTSSSWTSGCPSSTASRPPAGIVRDGAAPDARVLILTTFDADEHVVEALRAGASGFLLKDVTPDRLRGRHPDHRRRRRAARPVRHAPPARPLRRSPAAGQRANATPRCAT